LSFLASHLVDAMETLKEIEGIVVNIRLDNAVVV